MGERTPLFELHQELGARIVDFGGWDMPVQYSSQIAEHHAVRRTAGIFDVSHMCVIDIRGPGARPFLARVLANDVGKLERPGKGLYSCLLNDSGGVLDDLIVYFRTADFFRLVVNAGTRGKDLAWLRRHAGGFDVELTERTDLAILAVQGPQARARVAALLSAADREPALAIERFFGQELGGWFLARTGYTGEDGFELMLPASQAQAVWRELNCAGVVSCGLGARDTLRLEAGMNLYGNDMTEETNPYESGLGWTVALQPPGRDFVGRRALETVLEERQRSGVGRQLVGLILEERGVLRGHQKVVLPGHSPAVRATPDGDPTSAAADVGEVTSGTFSPTLERSIALARIPTTSAQRVQVDIRGRLHSARIVKPPFVRGGEIMVELPEKPR